MHRRTYLRGAAGLGIVAAAGCLGEDGPTALDAPDDQLADPADLAYPAYGQELPDATLPSPIHDRDVSTREFVGDRHTLLTFLFTRCHEVCPALTANLAQVQTHAAEDDYSDDVALVPVTFDPVYDTEDVLREFTEARGADPTAENWQFLRPESDERAEEVIGETFGVPFQQTDAYTPDEGDTHEMEFNHQSLTLLVNVDGYVERAYADGAPQPDVVLDDLTAVRNHFE